MNAKALQDQLQQFTAEHCGIEQRNYISLSRVSQPAHSLYEQLTGPHWTPDVQTQMRYLADRELKDAFLMRMDGYIGHVKELTAYGGLVRGHPDGVLVDLSLVQVKPCDLDTYLGITHTHRLPERDFEQLQAYLFYSRRQAALAVYVLRSTGEFYVVDVRYDARTATRLDSKLAKVVEAFRAGRRPECTCRRCERESAPVEAFVLP